MIFNCSWYWFYNLGLFRLFHNSPRPLRNGRIGRRSFLWVSFLNCKNLFIFLPSKNVLFVKILAIFEIIEFNLLFIGAVSRFTPVFFALFGVPIHYLILLLHIPLVYLLVRSTIVQILLIQRKILFFIVIVFR